MSQEMVVCTVTFLMRADDQILLARGKRRMNKGRWNGYGGKQDPGETILQSACRETEEEGRVRIDEKDLCYRGLIDFLWPEEGADVGVDGVKTVRCHMFIATKWQGEPTQTAESETPTWFGFDEIPYQDMFPGEKYWMPLLLAGKSFMGTLTYLKDGNVSVDDLDVREVPDDALPALK